MAVRKPTREATAVARVEGSQELLDLVAHVLWSALPLELDRSRSDREAGIECRHSRRRGRRNGRESHERDERGGPQRHRHRIVHHWSRDEAGLTKRGGEVAPSASAGLRNVWFRPLNRFVAATGWLQGHDAA